MEAQNLLILMSDQHSRERDGLLRPSDRADSQSGCACRAGTRFTACWSPSRFAFRRGRHSQPASTFTRSAFGTTPIPMTARSRAGITVCATRPPRRLDRQTALPLARRTTTDFPKRSFRCMLSTAKATCLGLSATICRCAGGLQDGADGRPRRVDVHAIRPRHRGARANLAARGGTEL